MDYLLEVFNTRELSLIIWLLVVILILFCTKTGRKFAKEIIPLAFNHKFVLIYIIFALTLILNIMYLRTTGFWNILLLKDTIFWVIVVQLPLLAKTIEHAKDSRFFINLIKENLAFIVIIEFLVDFWTFNILVELMIMPFAFLIGILKVLSEKNGHQVKKFLDGIFIFYGIAVLIYIIYNLIKHPEELFNTITLKQFLLPILLLFMNLPMVYGLSLYNMYEQTFMSLKTNKMLNKKERRKMKFHLFLFSGINLAKISSVRYNLMRTTHTSSTDSELKFRLVNFQKFLDFRIGDNYMKRTHCYIIWCIAIIIACFIGIIACNSTLPLKDLLTFNFALDAEKAKPIITHVLSIGLAVSVCFLFCLLGFRRKKYEDIFQVKKYSLYTLMFLIKQQSKLLLEPAPIDDPQSLFVRYVNPACDIKKECHKAVDLYENLLASWELDALKGLRDSSSVFVSAIGNGDICSFNLTQFIDHYNDKKSSSIQNEAINIFVSDVERSAKKYSEQISLCMEVFDSFM